MSIKGLFLLAKVDDSIKCWALSNLEVVRGLGGMGEDFLFMFTEYCFKTWACSKIIGGVINGELFFLFLIAVM